MAGSDLAIFGSFHACPNTMLFKHTEQGQRSLVASLSLLLNPRNYVCFRGRAAVGRPVLPLGNVCPERRRRAVCWVRADEA